MGQLWGRGMISGQQKPIESETQVNQETKKKEQWGNGSPCPRHVLPVYCFCCEERLPLTGLYLFRPIFSSSLLCCIPLLYTLHISTRSCRRKALVSSTCSSSPSFSMTLLYLDPQQGDPRMDIRYKVRICQRFALISTESDTPTNDLYVRGTHIIPPMAPTARPSGSDRTMAPYCGCTPRVHWIPPGTWTCTTQVLDWYRRPSGFQLFGDPAASEDYGPMRMHHRSDGP